ncbi:DUF4232 domain-containing protein [Auraticoccus monumenti]|uniref:DUF4232 domain-containing protein n=1 Tax=Auraticoccus monumenti TaxID=675864 RepID=A0A1G6UX56_9ACTN|nr:DUF4232 domain-containing protein [Auraticoccus monumenti]SDD45205.1 Protein of unknown function [Auraticoccus monumenti]
MRRRWVTGLVVAMVAAVVIGAVLLGRPAPRLEAVPGNQAPAPPVPSPDGPTSPQPVPTPPASASPSDDSAPGTDEVDALPLDSVGCEGSDRLVVSSGEVEAALGHRYLVLGVTNCTDEPFDLPARPDLRVRDADGSPVGTTFLPDEHRPTTATELAPGRSAYLQLHWLVAPLSTQPTAGHQLVFRLRPTLTATKRAQLDADGLTEVDVHDWAPTVSEAVDQ